MMLRAMKNANDGNHPSDYFSDIEKWPNNWMGVEEDLAIGRGLLALFIPFIQHLVDEGLAKKTIKNHGYHLSMLGGEIIERLNQLKSAEFSVLFCIFSLPDMITRTAMGEPQLRRKPVISRNGRRLTGRFSLPLLRSLPVSAFLSNPVLTRVPSGACRYHSFAPPHPSFSRGFLGNGYHREIPIRPARHRVRQGKRHSRGTKTMRIIDSYRHET
jgi:hypothetical protein